MIVSRAPLRFTLGGGGTDLPAYYETREEGGFVLSTAIDKHVYVTVNRRFEEGHLLKYSKTEFVTDIDAIEHPILRNAFQVAGPPKGEWLEVTSMAELPANSGLGSSSAFTVALLNSLYTYRGDILGPERLAYMAADLEINRMGEPIGRQDHYISALGGIQAMTFKRGEPVVSRPVYPGLGLETELAAWLMVFYTGQQRPAAEVLHEQARQIREDLLHPSSFGGDRMKDVRQMGIMTEARLTEGNLPGMAALMDAHWRVKQTMAASMSNEVINAHYWAGKEAGALGGKLLGAGGGGFLMFAVPHECRQAVRSVMEHRGLKPLHWRVARPGVVTVLHGG